MKFKTRAELYKYLNSIDFEAKRDTNMSSVYFLIKDGDEEEAVYFMPYNGAWFESPCMLREYSMTEAELLEYVQETYLKESWDDAYEYEKTMQRGNIHYEIDNFQCVPYLKEDFEIVAMMSESECLDWLLKKKEEYKANND